MLYTTNYNWPHPESSDGTDTWTYWDTFTNVDTDLKTVDTRVSLIENSRNLGVFARQPNQIMLAQNSETTVVTASVVVPAGYVMDWIATLRIGMVMQSGGAADSYTGLMLDGTGYKEDGTNRFNAYLRLTTQYDGGTVVSQWKGTALAAGTHVFVGTGLNTSAALQVAALAGSTLRIEATLRKAP